MADEFPNTFRNWMTQVDQTFVEHTSLGYEDWPDGPYYDMWSDYVSPRDAVATILFSEYGQEALFAFNLDNAEPYV